MTPRPGDAFGAYTIVREVGRGGMAVVFEATHTGLEKRVALKVLHANDDDLVRRFQREGAAASRTRHEHLVEVFDTGVIDGTAFVVMEFLEGEDLSALVAREGPLDAPRLADVFLPVVSALSSAHAAGVVHRDVKPDNIFLSRDRRGAVQPKLVDFGVARVNALDDDAQKLTGSAALIGSVGYVSPEQVLDHDDIGPRSDQYSLGVSMYECLTGRLPFARPTVFGALNAILKGKPDRPTALNPAADPRLEAVVLRAMAREPDARFASLRELGAALLPFASPPARAHWSSEFGETPPSDETDRSTATDPVLAVASAVAPAPPRSRPRGPLPVVAALTAMVVAAGAFAWRATPVAPRRAAPPPAAPIPSPAATPAVTEPAPARPVAASTTVTPPPVAEAGHDAGARRVVAAPPRRARRSPEPRRVDAAAVTNPAASGEAPSSPTPWLLRTRY
ncbi:MAG: serine/threonine-protein kinase [Polyangiales bacterium]